MKMAGFVTAALVAGVMCMGQTKLVHDGRVLFESNQKVSYGATYDERVVKVVVDGKEAASVAIYAGKQPKNVFVNRELLPKGNWNYDAATACVKLSLPAGSSAVQMRFDDMTSLKPVPVAFPVQLDGKVIGELKGESVDEAYRAVLSWPADSGIYIVKATAGSVAVRNAKPLNGLDGVEDGTCFFLQQHANLEVCGKAPSGNVPAVTVTAKAYGRSARLKTMDRKALLDDASALKVEGEAFARTVNGEVSKSTSHKNTSGGGCIFNWGTKGCRVDWELNVPAAGRYRLTFVYSNAEQISLRTLAVNGKLVNGASLLEFPSTGGWGHGPAKEWQALALSTNGMDDLALELPAGTCTVSLTNLLGQHLNIDCVVLQKLP